MKQQLLRVTTWRGLTPLAVIAVIGMTSYAVGRTLLMVGCHLTQPWPACEQERKDWQGEMALVAGGFWLLYTRAPGTSEAPPTGGIVQAVPPWRRPEDEAEPLPVVVDPPARPSEVINPDTISPEPPAPEPTTAERMERAARRRRGGAR